MSVRRVEDITEALWGVGEPGNGIQPQPEDLPADRGLAEPAGRGPTSYVYLDGIVLKRSWTGEVRNVSLLVAISVNAEGYREILGIVEGAKEDKAGWSGFLKHLKARGLAGIELVISDACQGLVESAAEFYPEPAGSAARCISTATSSAMYRRRSCARWLS